MTQFLAKGPLDRNALYQIDGGGNDIVNQTTLLLTGQISQEQAQAASRRPAVDLATQVGKLQAAGAQYVIVQNLRQTSGKVPRSPLWSSGTGGRDQYRLAYSTRRSMLR